MITDFDYLVMTACFAGHADLYRFYFAEADLDDMRMRRSDSSDDGNVRTRKRFICGKGRHMMRVLCCRLSSTQYSKADH
jgi:hypothetical protein